MDYLVQKTDNEPHLSDLYSDLEEKLLCLDLCMKKLPPEYQELIQHIYFNDNSTVQLAQASGKTPNAIYKLLGRIRAMLHECMEQTLNLKIKET